jgi:hypothetical protein
MGLTARWRWMIPILFASCTLAVGAFLPGAGTADAATAATPSWSDAVFLPGSPANDPVQVDALSCTAPGDCTAAGIDYRGIYLSSRLPPQYGFVVDERNGRWGKLQDIPGLPPGGLSTSNTAPPSIGGLSCASPGNCLVGGSYGTDADGDVGAFTVEEKNGVWGHAMKVPGLAALGAQVQTAIYAVSCGKPGDCTVVGLTQPPDTYDATLVMETEQNYTWSAARAIPDVTSVSEGLALSDPPTVFLSCTGSAACAIAGVAGNGDFLVAETGGTWRSTDLLPAGATVAALSCAAAGDCTVGGSFATTASAPKLAAVWYETEGNWSAAHFLPGGPPSTQSSGVTQLSCTAPGDCTAVGDWQFALSQPFVVTESGGTWKKPQPVPGLPIPSSPVSDYPQALSCAAPGTCAMGGFYGSSYSQAETAGPAFLADETGGAWGKAHAVPGLKPAGSTKAAEVSAISCAPGGYCAAAGSVSVNDPLTPAPTQYQTAFVTNWKAGATTTLGLSAAKVTYGHEQTERLTVRVAARYGGPATGIVKITTGKTAVCTIVVKSGTGTCTLAASKLRPGTYHLTANYTGDADATGAISSAQTLTVVKR